jgi:tRNA threonylcarbamoyladenosine biosynthesis protein TsaB
MLLGIDTCGGTGTIALARWSDDSVVPLAQMEFVGKTYSARLVPGIHEMLAAQSAGVRDLQAVVVVNGPGSFTGVRIGLSSAKALAEALSVPLVAVSRLAVLAQKGGTGAATLDAGRGEFYFRAQAAEALLTPEEVRERLSGPLAVCEESASLVFPEAVVVDPPTAADTLLYAQARLLAKDFEDVVTVDGNYLRRSDAELFAKRGVQSGIAKV